MSLVRKISMAIVVVSLLVPASSALRAQADEFEDGTEENKCTNPTYYDLTWNGPGLAVCSGAGDACKICKK